MRRNQDLESRLIAWAHEYGGGRYENIGYPKENVLQRVIDHKGFMPDSGGFKKPPMRTQADDVQEAVSALERQEKGWGPSLALRCEYFNARQPIEEKLRAMSRLGVSASRVRYYQLLRLGKVHVAAWLHLPFSDERDEAEQECETTVSRLE